MSQILFTAVDYRQNEYGFCPGGLYRFRWDGHEFVGNHIANGPDGLAPTFTLDIEPAESNFLAHCSADQTFYNGVTLTNGRFARSQAFAARLAPPAESSPDAYSQSPDSTRPLAETARQLSSGTLAALIGASDYATIEAIQAAFVAWCERHFAYASWQEAWQGFEASSAYVDFLPPTLASLAADLATAGHATATKIKHEQIVAEAKTRLRPHTPQGEPVGLFDEGQGRLFL